MGLNINATSNLLKELKFMKNIDTLDKFKKLDYAELKANLAERKQTELERHNRVTEAANNKRMDLMLEITRLTEAGKDARAAKKELSDVEKVLNFFQNPNKILKSN